MSVETSLDYILGSLRRQRDAEETLVALHSERLNDLTIQIVAFEEERDRLLGRVSLDVPQLPGRAS